MGSDPAPFMANLSPFYYEDKWIKKTTLKDLIEARKFNMFWFIDDLAAINDGEWVWKSMPWNLPSGVRAETWKQIKIVNKKFN